MSGFVCSLKPLKLARANRVEEARAAIASSTFRRFFRLGGPAIVSTIISWFCDSIGVFTTARSIPQDPFTVQESLPFLAGLKELFSSLVEIHYFD